MLVKHFAAAAALAGCFAASSALAAPGVATGNVNMRVGQTTSAPRITTIPAGARVEVHGCPNWCDVTYRGRRGWVSSSYISTGGYSGQPVYVPAPQPRYVYPRPRVPAPAFVYGSPRYHGYRHGYRHGYGHHDRRRRGGVTFSFGY